MEPFDFDAPVDARAELQTLLERNQVDHTRQGELYCFTFAQRECRWRTCCRPLDQAVVIYGIYPFPVRQTQALQEVCTRVNSRVLYGSLFVREDRLVFRTCADLFDPYTAAEALTRALEYNAGVIMEFWKELFLSAQA